MNPDNLKPIGAFLEYTVRPIMDEFKWFLVELDKRGIKITEQNIERVLRSLLDGYVFYAILGLFQSVIITLMVCVTAWLIIQKGP